VRQRALAAAFTRSFTLRSDALVANLYSIGVNAFTLSLSLSPYTSLHFSASIPYNDFKRG
jgi:hypothetical protein